MKELLIPGKYIVAVSGGIDSVSLLHALTSDKSLHLIVAHFDHGIRDDSALDAKFVANLARELGLSFVTQRVKLGFEASEAVARKHRYKFLHRACIENNADAIVTAHHQDDVIETAIINTLRGTKRRGLISLKSTELIKRPLT